jgi:hypothetical protein
MMYLERTGRRTLICGAIAALMALCWHSKAPAQIAQDKSYASKQPGRYQIIMHPTFRADQYLLDTSTGQIWQLTTYSTLQGEPVAWRYRLDNQSDMLAFINSRGFKKQEGSELPPAGRSKPRAAPVKLN